MRYHVIAWFIVASEWGKDIKGYKFNLKYTKGN